MPVEVPVLDLDDAASPRPERRRRAAAALARGFGDLGLVTVAGHGVSDADLVALQEAVVALAALPRAVRQACHRPDLWHQRGWTPPDTETAVAAGGRPDFKECWFAAPVEVDPEAGAFFPELCPPNVWPDDGGRLEGAMVPAGRALHQVGRLLLDAADQALGFEVGTLAALADGGAHVTRALHYLPTPPGEAPGEVPWGEEHTDFNLVTVLGGGRFLDPSGAPAPSPDPEAGLHVRTRATADAPTGRLVRGVAAPGHLLCQVGQQLEILSGGAFLATPHVVRAPRSPGWSRTSVAHFVHIHPLRTLAPLPPRRTPEAVAAYRPAQLAGTYAVKTLVDLGLAPRDALDALGYRHHDRVGGARAGT